MSPVRRSRPEQPQKLIDEDRLSLPRDEYPALFPQRLMFKDFSLIMQRALELAVAMPATAAAAQVAAAGHTREAAAGR